MKDVSVLITAAGNVFMPGTTTCLRNNGERKIRLVAADLSEDPSILNMCDAAYQVPRGDSPEYVDALLKICEKENIDVLLPIMSVELNALAEHRERFEEIGTKVSVSDEPALTVANNKRKLLDFLREQKLPCAEYYVAHSIADVKEAARLLGYPGKRVCIKATEGS